MMVQLLIWRHAQAQTPKRTQPDCERALDHKGQKDKIILARYIEGHFSPEFILCSTAKRTQETAQALSEKHAITLSNILYNASMEDLINLAQKHGQNYQRILFVGHNPGQETLARSMKLTDPNIAQKFSTYLPCSLSVITWDTTWHEINSENGAVTDYQNPISLQATNL